RPLPLGDRVGRDERVADVPSVHRDRRGGRAGARGRTGHADLAGVPARAGLVRRRDRQGDLPPGRRVASRHDPQAAGPLRGEGFPHVPLPGQHGDRLAPLDRRPGRRPRIPGERRWRRVPGDRQRPELHDARTGMVAQPSGAATAMNRALQQFLDDHPGRDLNRDGLRLHYIDEGAGDPVVMLHGNPTWSFYYRHLIDDLRGSHRVIVPDQIGFRLSDKPADSGYDYTLARRVEDLEALLDRLSLDRDLTLVLHDWGGIIGMTYAARNPERIARLVVCNTAAFHIPAG